MPASLEEVDDDGNTKKLVNELSTAGSEDASAQVTNKGAVAALAVEKRQVLGAGVLQAGRQGPVSNFGHGSS